MTTPIVVYVNAAAMRTQTGGDYFGYCFYRQNRVLVRDDLPARVRRAVLEHELYHAAHGDRGSFWRNEPGAWWAQLRVEPLGTLYAVLLSLTPSRIGLYVRRLFADQ